MTIDLLTEAVEWLRLEQIAIARHRRLNRVNGACMCNNNGHHCGPDYYLMLTAIGYPPAYFLRPGDATDEYMAKRCYHFDHTGVHPAWTAAHVAALRTASPADRRWLIRVLNVQPLADCQAANAAFEAAR